MKKSSIVLGSLMGLAVTVTAVSAAVAGFNDIPSDHWAAKSVENLKNAGVIQGYTDGTFQGNKEISRYEVAVIVNNNNEDWKKKMDAMTVKLTALEEKVADLGEMMEEDKINTVAGEEWNIIKEYVTSNYPISEAYFDEHFKFVSSETGVKVHGDYDYEKEEWSTLLSDLTQVNYKLTLEDADGQIQNFTDFNRIYLKDNKVLESNDMPEGLSSYEKSNFRTSSYDIIAPTRELKILLPKVEAITLAKSTPECVDEEWFTDLSEAEEDMALRFVFGEVYWNWESNLSYCHINAETEEIDINQQLED